MLEVRIVFSVAQDTALITVAREGCCYPIEKGWRIVKRDGKPLQVEVCWKQHANGKLNTKTAEMISQAIVNEIGKWNVNDIFGVLVESAPSVLAELSGARISAHREFSLI